MRSEVIATIGGVKLRRVKGDMAFCFVAGHSIDADGSPSAYHPDGSPPGLDHLANAGSPGNWWGIATDRNGRPYIQGDGDPAPGFYVSTTALQRSSRAARDPRRYVNASRLPFVVLSSEALEIGGARLGDFAMVWNSVTGREAAAIVADIGPRNRLGEGSISLARALGIPSSPKSGGQAARVAYIIFPRSGNGKPRTRGTIDTSSRKHYDAWGGLARLRAITRLT